MRPKDYSRDRQAWLDYFLDQGEFWIFGYGSLMWRPDFMHSGAFECCAEGVSRRYCIISVAYRGTPECPGRVLGLVEEGSCHGMAFCIQGKDIEPSFNEVWRREMITEAYLPKMLDVRLTTGEQKQALGFLADPDHAQYDNSSTEAEVACIIKQAVGPFGRNIDYANETFQHLQQLGVHDDRLWRLHKTLNES